MSTKLPYKKGQWPTVMVGDSQFVDSFDGRAYNHSN